MPDYSIIWTPLPHGVDDQGRPRLSAHLAVRLSTAGVLRDYPEWTNWPATLAGLRVTLDFPTLTRGVATLVSEPSGAAWTAVFPDTTAVHAHEFLGRGFRRIRSYPVDTVHGFAERCYGRLGARFPENYPTGTAADDAFAVILPDQGSERKLAERFDTGPASGPEQWAVSYPDLDPADTTSAGLAAAFSDAESFHHRLPYDTFPTGAAPVPPSPPTIDFHQAVAHIGDHPMLQRMVGLVLDLRIDRPGNEQLITEVFSAPARDTVLTLVLAWPSATRTVGDHSVISTVSCRVGREADGTPVFRIGERPGGDITAGMLRIGGTGREKPKYAVTVADTDSGALVIRQFARNVDMSAPDKGRTRAAAGPQAGENPMSYALPALRGRGIGVARINRATTVARALAEGAARDAAFTARTATEPLTADAVISGYRWDVYDEVTGVWRSLMRREGRYEFARAPGLSVAVADEGSTASAVTTSADPASTDLYAHESIVRWEGWSLVVPRPGRAVRDDGSTSDHDPEPDPAFGFTADYRVPPGSLPALRFGRGYRLRARAVDLAGNSLTAAEADRLTDPALATALTKYRRFEPVPAPDLLVPRPPGPADEESVTAAVIHSQTGEQPTRDRALRRAIPPRTSVRLVEEHGLLPTLGSVPRQYLELSARDSAGGEHGPHIPVAYLPEALAREVEVRGAPGPPLNPIPMMPRRWPRAQPFDIVVSAGTSAAAEFRADVRELRVRLRPGDVYLLRLSARLAETDLDQLGVWRWILDAATAERVDLDPLRESAVTGRHWMLSPFRDLLVVHAVRQPLFDPRVEPGFAVRREPHDIEALLVGKITFCARSTGNLDILGSWEEPVDNGPGTDDPVTPTPSTAHVFTYHHARDNGAIPDEATWELRGVSHQFGDTRHREVAYRAVSTSRFLEHFPQDGGPTTRTSPPGLLDVPSTARPAPPRIAYVIPIFHWENDQAGRSIRRTGLRVYLHRPWWSSGAGESLGVVLYAGPDDPPQAAAAHVSRWAADPVVADRSVAPPLPLDIGSFPLSTATATEGLRLAETDTGQIHVAAHQVHFDPGRDLWYCDLRIIEGRRPDGSEQPVREYFPFIRLALARYQPHSLPDCHLSPVTVAEFCQLAPDRTASVTGDGDLRTVLVSGAAPAENRNRVLVTVETPRPGVADLGDPLAWKPHGPPEELDPNAVGGPGQLTWTGRLDLSSVPAGPRRLVVEEFEVRGSHPDPAGAPLPGLRLVHTDVLPLT